MGALYGSTPGRVISGMLATNAQLDADRSVHAEPWSNGKVGMTGVSYLACIQYLVAGRAVEAAGARRDQSMGGLFRLVS